MGSQTFSTASSSIQSQTKRMIKFLGSSRTASTSCSYALSPENAKRVLMLEPSRSRFGVIVLSTPSKYEYNGTHISGGWLLSNFLVECGLGHDSDRPNVVIEYGFKGYKAPLPRSKRSHTITQYPLVNLCRHVVPRIKAAHVAIVASMDVRSIVLFYST